jgi:hypothetical protein
MFIDILKNIFQIKDFTIENLKTSFWYKSMHEFFELEIQELNQKSNTVIEDPYSIMLKKRIESKLKKEDDFYVEF